MKHGEVAKLLTEVIIVQLFIQVLRLLASDIVGIENEHRQGSLNGSFICSSQSFKERRRESFLVQPEPLGWQKIRWNDQRPRQAYAAAFQRPRFCGDSLREAGLR